MGITSIIIVAAVGLLVVLWAVGVYNRLVVLRNRFRNGFAQIDVQLQRRHDLIPNLVEVAKGYIKHERETLEAVISARGAAAQARSLAAADPTQGGAITALAVAEGTLSGSLGRLFALAEAYPDLKANTTMMQLSEELSTTENRVAFARQAFNDAVMTYNNAREVFPASLVAAQFGFQPAALLEIQDPAQRVAPSVKFT